MKKPEIKEQKAIEYIEHIEKKLKSFEANTVLTRLYNGLKKQVGNISDIFETIVVDETTLKSGDDKSFDRYLKFLEKSVTIYENLEKLEKKIIPEEEKKTKIRDDASVEQHIFKDDS